MDLTRRAFLGAGLGAAVAAWPDPVGARRRRLEARGGGAGNRATAGDVPWNDLGRLLRERYRDPRRHFVFEYYPIFNKIPDDFVDLGDILRVAST